VSAASDKPQDGATPAAGGDPAGWALPADAGVAAGGASGAAAGAEPAGAYAAGAQAGTGAGARGSGGSDPLSALLEKLPPEQQQLIESKPEILAGGAFAVGFVVAKILKRIGGG
jgi:hypothetical protein